MVYPQRKKVPSEAWAPSVHYAQTQTLPPCTFARRRLYNFELLYVRQGKLITRMEHPRMEQQEYAVHAGQLIFLASGVYHQNEVVGEGSNKFLGIHFDFFGESLIMREEDMIVDEEKMEPGKFSWEAVTPPFQPLSADPVYTPGAECLQAMERLVDEYTMRPVGYEWICRGLMLEILASLLRSQHSLRLIKSSVHSERIRGCMEEIERNPGQSWSNLALANRMNMHEDHFSKLFREIAGIPPGEYIRSLRLREARRLLRETDETIERVGDQVGYPDIHYFSRIFKANEGISPRAYRKLSRIL